MSDEWGAFTTLLLHMEGDNGSNTFTDTSPFPKTVTAYGNAQISTAQSKWSNGSGYFDGDGAYLSTPYNNGFSFGSGDCTVEAMVYIAGNSVTDNDGNRSATIVNTWPNGIRGWALNILGSGTTTGTALGFDSWSNVSGNATLYRGAVTISQNTWHHIAASVQSGMRRLFVDGSLISGSTITIGNGYTTINAFDSINIGKTKDIGYPIPLNGYLQDLRITKGIARYTANFTPPAARLPDAFPVGLIIPSGYSRDIYDGGSYRIIGNVSELGISGSYRVRLFDRQSARCIRGTWSDVSGAYVFNNLAYRPNGYFTIAYDHGDNPLNAAIADLITPELMS